MSLFHLPPGFPPKLAFLWPLIWVQVLMLRAQIRAAYGRGVKYRWSVTDNLRVSLVSIDWIPGQKSEREWLKPRANFNDRLAAACDGRAAALEYLHLQFLIPPLAPADDVRLHVVESPGGARLSSPPAGNLTRPQTPKNSSPHQAPSRASPALAAMLAVASAP
jgi:hypothetical protein